MPKCLNCLGFNIGKICRVQNTSLYIYLNVIRLVDLRSVACGLAKITAGTPYHPAQGGREKERVHTRRQPSTPTPARRSEISRQTFEINLIPSYQSNGTGVHAAAPSIEEAAVVTSVPGLRGPDERQQSGTAWYPSMEPGTCAQPATQDETSPARQGT